MKQMKKDALDLTTLGITLGVGSSVVQKTGGDASGLQMFGSYVPLMANVKGAGHALSLLKRLKL